MPMKGCTNGNMENRRRERLGILVHIRMETGKPRQEEPTTLCIRDPFSYSYHRKEVGVGVPAVPTCKATVTPISF